MFSSSFAKKHGLPDLKSSLNQDCAVGSISSTKKAKLSAEEDHEHYHQFKVTDYTCDNKDELVKQANHNHPMHKLPYNVVAHIFKFLHPIERIKIESVCRRWNFIGWNFCWMDVRMFSAQIVYHNTLFLRNQRVNKPIKPLLSRCGKYVKEVDLSRFQHDISHLKYLVLKSTPNAHTLNVSGLRASSELLLTIPLDLPKLKSIDFSGCHLKNLEEELLILFEECEELQSVNLSNNRLEGALAFDHIPIDLTYLNIEYCDRLSGVALQILSLQCKKLESLVISDLNNYAVDINRMLCKLTSLKQLVFNNYLLSEEDPSQELTAFNKLIHLSHLELKNNELVTDEVLISIARNCKRLNRIVLSNSENYTEAGWRALDKIPKLEKQKRITKFSYYNRECAVFKT